MPDNTCVCCGSIIPEGWQICWSCKNAESLEDYQKCLKWICEEDAAICNHPYVYPCSWCAEVTGIPVKKVRKIMKQLEAEGYVVKDYEGGWDEWNGKLYCIHGYSVTEKGRQTKYWQEKDHADREYWDRSVNGNA